MEGLVLKFSLLKNNLTEEEKLDSLKEFLQNNKKEIILKISNSKQYEDTLPKISKEFAEKYFDNVLMENFENLYKYISSISFDSEVELFIKQLNDKFNIKL